MSDDDPVYNRPRSIKETVEHINKTIEKMPKPAITAALGARGHTRKTDLNVDKAIGVPDRAVPDLCHGSLHRIRFSPAATHIVDDCLLRDIERASAGVQW
jgi:hypothetical protein